MPRKTSAPAMTLLLMLIIIIVFAIELFDGGIIERYSFMPAYVLSEPWRLVTSVFLHGDISHIFFNMATFIIFGRGLERMIGPGKFLLLFLASGVIGNIGYMVTSSDSMIPAIGASGAIYGIMGTMAILEPLAIVWVGFPVPMIVAAFIWGVTEFSGLFVPSFIARGSHLGGLFFGVVYGLYLRKRSAK